MAILSILSMLTLVGSGVIAGVFFAIALGVVPTLNAMPPDRYVYVHRLMGHHWHPTMPALVLGTSAGDFVLAIAAPGATARPLFAVAMALLLGAAWVSHYCNRPINEVVRAGVGVAGSVPDEVWQDPRPTWRRWHLVRTVLGMVAFVANATAVVPW